MKTVEARIGLAFEKRFGSQLSVPNDLAHGEALATINERSVCRNYSKQPIEESLITLVCATALSAPSKSDLQQATILRVCSPEKRDAIHRLIPGSPWIASAPEFLVVCGDHSRLRHMFSERGQDFPNNHLDSFFNAAVDGGIVLATLVQAAHLAGLGSCPISEIRDHATEISEMLKLPQWVFPIAGLTLGYPLSLEPFSPRLGLEATIFVDQYDSSEMAENIARYDSRRIHQKPYSRQREPLRFGETPNYGWSEEKFRQYSDVQRAEFGDFIRRRGFKLE